MKIAGFQEFFEINYETGTLGGVIWRFTDSILQICAGAWGTGLVFLKPVVLKQPVPLLPMAAFFINSFRVNDVDHGIGGCIKYHAPWYIYSRAG